MEEREIGATLMGIIILGYGSQLTNSTDAVANLAAPPCFQIFVGRFFDSDEGKEAGWGGELQMPVP